MSTCYSVITADVVDSRKISSFRKVRDRRLAALSNFHLNEKLILSPYAVTAWDEFQVVLRRPELTPRVIFDMRRLLFPFELWIAVGLGNATGVRKAPVNIHGGGEAFERARMVADRLKTEFSKYRVLTGFESGNEVFDTIANTIYRLHDSLLEQTTLKQWETINARFETEGQDETARRLKLNISTISRNLKRGSYWQMIETSAAMKRIICAYF